MNVIRNILGERRFADKYNKSNYKYRRTLDKKTNRFIDVSDDEWNNRYRERELARRPAVYAKQREKAWMEKQLKVMKEEERKNAFKEERGYRKSLITPEIEDKALELANADLNLLEYDVKQRKQESRRYTRPHNIWE